MADAVDLRTAKNDQVDLHGGMVFITVQEKRFRIHRRLITAHSGRIKNILDTRAQAERDCHDVTLELQSATVFGVYMQYLYTRRIPCKSDDLHSSDSDYRPLIELYLLAEHLQDIDAMDATVDAVLAVYNDTATEVRSVPTRSIIEHVFGNSEPWSKLRKLFLDILSWEGDEGSIDDDDDDDDNDDEHTWTSGEPPQDLLRDLARRNLALNKAIREGTPYPTSLATAKVCEYHEHKPDRECQSLKRKREDEEDEATGGEPRHGTSKIRKLEAELERAKAENERLRSAVPAAPDS